MQFKKHTLKTAHRAEVYSVLSHLVINKWSKRVNCSHYEVSIGAQLVTQRLQANSQKDKVLCQAGRWWPLATPRLGREAQTKSFLEKTFLTCFRSHRRKPCSCFYANVVESLTEGKLDDREWILRFLNHQYFQQHHCVAKYTSTTSSHCKNISTTSSQCKNTSTASYHYCSFKKESAALFLAKTKFRVTEKSLYIGIISDTHQIFFSLCSLPYWSSHLAEANVPEGPNPIEAIEPRRLQIKPIT